MSKIKGVESKTMQARLLRRLFSAIIFSFVLIISFPTAALGASLDELEQQQQAAQDQANNLKQQAAEKQSSINSIQDLVDKLTADINSYQNQINTTQKNIVLTEKSIATTETQIQQQQAELETNMAKQAEALQTMYVMGQKSTLETFLSSDSFSEASARQQYLTALSDKIESMMKTIKQIKADLESKRDSLKQRQTELSVQKQQLTSYQATIIAQKNEQDTLLNGAVAEKQKILAAAKDAQKQSDHLTAQIYSLRAQMAADGHEVITSGSSGGYPYAGLGKDSGADPWGFYYRECTSYAAWYWNAVEHRSWYRDPGNGDAWAWPRAVGANSVSTHPTPAVGAIISWGKSSSSPYGHVAIVQKINDDKTIDVSEYNYTGNGTYDYRANINPAAYGSYSYIY